MLTFSAEDDLKDEAPRRSWNLITANVAAESIDKSGSGQKIGSYVTTKAVCHLSNCVK